MAEPKPLSSASGHDKLMIGQSSTGIYVAHAVLILGLVIVAFPIYYTFVASTQTLQTILRPPLPLLHLLLELVNLPSTDELFLHPAD